MKFLLVIAGGGLGAAMRYGVRLALPPEAEVFPYATLLVNVGGSFIAGAVAGALAGGLPLSEEMRLFVLIGVLGAFTTFSAFFAGNGGVPDERQCGHRRGKCFSESAAVRRRRAGRRFSGAHDRVNSGCA